MKTIKKFFPMLFVLLFFFTASITMLKAQPGCTFTIWNHTSCDITYSVSLQDPCNQSISAGILQANSQLALTIGDCYSCDFFIGLSNPNMYSSGQTVPIELYGFNSNSSMQSLSHNLCPGSNYDVELSPFLMEIW